MPVLAGFTEILTTPCLSETPLLRMPAPCARTRTPGTRLLRRVTTAVIVLRVSTVSVFVWTVSARAHRRRRQHPDDRHDERALLIPVVGRVGLRLGTDDDGHVQDRARLERPYPDRHADGRPHGHRADGAGHEPPGSRARALRRAGRDIGHRRRQRVRDHDLGRRARPVVAGGERVRERPADVHPIRVVGLVDLEIDRRRRRWRRQRRHRLRWRLRHRHVGRVGIGHARPQRRRARRRGAVREVSRHVRQRALVADRGAGRQRRAAPRCQRSSGRSRAPERP